MRVLHVAETARGGVGTYLEEIVPSQVRRYGAGNVRVVLPHGDLRLLPAIPGGTASPFRAIRGGRLGTTLSMAMLATRHIVGWQPDVVHLHSTFAGLLRPLLPLLPHTARVVYCAHGWAFDRDTGWCRRRAMQATELLLSTMADAVVSVSPHDDRRAANIGIAPDRCWLVTNGVADAPRATPASDTAWPDGCLRVLFVGRLDRQKGADVLYAAMRKLGDQAHAIVVGAPVVGRSRTGNAPANVHLAGWLSRPQINALYAAADVLVAPSRWEGLPLVALEAMRSGLPVVGSRIGGLEDVVTDGVCGRLFKPGDVDELVHLLEGIQGPQLAEMGRRGRARFLARFQSTRVVHELDCLYRELAGSQFQPTAAPNLRTTP